MKRYACNFFSVFFALLLCVGLIPAVAFAQPDEGESNTQAAPHEAFNLEEGTYVEGEVLVLVDGQLPQSNSRSTQSETQDLFSFSELVASTADGDLLVGEEADKAVAQSSNENIATMSEAGNDASSDNTSSNSAATDISSASDATDTPQIEQASTDARIVLVKDENKSTAQLLDEYAAMPGVLYVQPNYLYELTSLNGSYNDPYIDKQWFLEDSNIEGNPAGVGVENAWSDGNYGGAGYQASTTSQSAASNSATEEAVVAVIDTGVRYNHPDLEDSMWTGGEEVAQELGWSTDVDGNGTDQGIACCYDTYALTADDQATAGDVDGFGPMDKNGHGTHVAGIVGAQLNNNEGGSGVAPGVKIMGLRAAGDFFPSSGVFKVFQYVQTAKQMGVNVVAANNS